MGDIVHAGVHEHHGVDAVEEALGLQDVLAAASLLARRAERDGRAADPVDHLRQPDRRTDAGGRHDIVAAALAVDRQSVIFAEEGDARSGLARAGGRAEGSLERAQPLLHREASRAERRALPSLRLHFLERQFDLGMHSRADVEQCCSCGVDRRACGGLDRRQIAQGWCSLQWLAISMRRANHTSGNDLAYLMKSYTALARAGWPATRMCRPIDIILGNLAPSLYSRSKV